MATSRRCVGVFVWFGWLVAPALVLAHGGAPQKPTPAELARVEPPLEGSGVFARALIANVRGRLDAHGLAHLDELAGLLGLADQARAGQIPGQGAGEADYYRWRAERLLVEIARDLPGTIVVDRRAPAPARVEAEPLPLDPDRDLLLVRIRSGNGPERFRLHSLDLTGERDEATHTLTAASTGTTFVLVTLEHAPKDSVFTHLAVQFEGAERPEPGLGLRLRARAFGQLALTVQDERGEPTPALIRLTAMPGGRLWEPAGSVDLTPLMNQVTGLPIYGPGRGYEVPLPGPARGRYWVVPGPFTMALPAGDWAIHVWHGPEYAPAAATIRVEPEAWTRHTIPLRRPIDMPARGWFSGDDHVHARLMSSEDADKLIAFARAADVHVTNVLEMGDEKRTYYAQRGFGPEFRVRSGRHWLIPGQEDPRSVLGHAIGLNLKEKVRDLDRYLLNDWIAEVIHRQGGLYGHTHVGPDACFVHREMALFTPLGIVDFNSVMQFTLGTERYFEFLNLGFKMTASAGTDTPYGGTVGAVRLYAYTGPEFTPDRWFDAVRRGRTFVTNGPMVELTVAGAGPGEEIAATGSRPLRVAARAVGIAGSSAPERLELIRLGRTLQEARAPDASAPSLELTTEVEPGDGFWIAARAVGRDGSEALTTPVYVVRPGFRFWDPDQAGDLLRRQLDVLDEIEGEIARAEKVLRDGRNPLDEFHRLTAEQAVPLRSRLDRVRGLYKGLQKQLTEEQPRRRADPGTTRR